MTNYEKIQSMSPGDLAAAYAVSARPYIEAPGPVPECVLKLKSWRYVLEISSMCNLHCALCHAGNRSGYEYHPGVMEMGLFERILDKIKMENPQAIVCCYVNSEPFLHPHLPECISSIKRRGFRCEVASNLNYMANLDQMFAAKPDLFTVSVSGWDQEIYERAHRGGNIETVRKNLVEAVEARRRGGHYDVFMGISYHMYRDNQGEQMRQMSEFAASLGIPLMLSYGRTICIENTVQALRFLDAQAGKEILPFVLVDKFPDMNALLPPAKPEFIESMRRLQFHPATARDLYARFPESPVCLIADVFTEIRWDGRVQLCAWTDDMRLTLGNYLEMSPEQISEARRGHPLCQECLKHRLNYYFHITDCLQWSAQDNPYRDITTQ